MPPLSGSAFIRTLAALSDAQAPAVDDDFAQRVRQWFDWTDAFALSAALSGEAGLAAAPFRSAHPGIQPDVQLDDRIDNWVTKRADIGFRIGASPNEGVVGRRLFPVQLIVCASPAYLERHGVPTTPDDLAQHCCSVFRHPATGKIAPWYLSVQGEVEHLHLTPALSTNDTELEIQAVLAGQVIGQLANFAAAPHIHAGRLVPVLLPYLSNHIGRQVCDSCAVASVCEKPNEVAQKPDFDGPNWLV